MGLAEAIDLFQRRGEDDKVRLLQHHVKDYLVLYEMRKYAGYFHGYMAPSAGLLGYFALHPYPPGFILRFPQRNSLELEPVIDYPKLSISSASTVTRGGCSASRTWAR